jgi:hypothetical protein
VYCNCSVWRNKPAEVLCVFNSDVAECLVTDDAMVRPIFSNGHLVALDVRPCSKLIYAPLLTHRGLETVEWYARGRRIPSKPDLDRYPPHKRIKDRQRSLFLWPVQSVSVDLWRVVNNRR